MKKLNFENEKGITLIALVITIIVLLILAGVSIATLTGNNGVITQSVKAKTENTHAQLFEEMQLEAQSYQLEVSTGQFYGTLEEYLNRNSDKPIVNNDGVINVKNLLGKTLPLGNGTSKETGDVYVLEQEVETANENGNKEVAKIASLDNVKVADTNTSAKNYKVVYYGKTGEENTDLGKLISDSNQLEEENLEYSYLYSVNNDGELNFNPYYSYYAFENGKERIRLFSKNGLKLTNISLVLPSRINGKKVTAISDNLRAAIMELKKVKIPNGVETISYFAFANSTIEEIQIPLSVQKIEGRILAYCTNLKTIYYEGTEEDWNKIEIDTPNSELTKDKIVFNCDENAITESAEESTEKREDISAYWVYAWDILKSLSQEEIKELYFEGLMYWQKEYYEYLYPGQEITKELIVKHYGCNSYDELLEKKASECDSLEEYLVRNQYVKPAEYFGE